jgi:hypothetical protein
MSTDFRSLCAEMLTAWQVGDDIAGPMNRARRLLAQPEPVAPTDDELMDLWLDGMNTSEARGSFAFARAVLAKWGNSDSLPQPVWADIHYAWELQDADGEWQAGGSANSLDDVQREGSRYLQTYMRDGPHKLIIQRHCVNTINEVTP